MDFEIPEQHEPGSVLPYLLSPVSFCTSLVILILTYVIVPFIGPRFIPNYNGLEENEGRFDNFIGTSLHHAVVPALAVYALASGAITNQVHVQNQSVLGLYILQMTQGFMVAELIVVLCDPIQRRRRGFLFAFHHVLFILGGGYMAFLSRGYGLFFTASFEITEISAFFLYLPAMMVLVGQVRKDSIAYRVFIFLQIWSWIITRFLLIPWQWYEYVRMLLDPASQVLPLFVKIGLFCFIVVSHSMFIYQFILIVRKNANLFVASHRVKTK